MPLALSSTPLQNARLGGAQVVRMYSGTALVWQQRPVVTSEARSTSVGTAFSYQITATNSPHTSYGASGLPTGLGVNTLTGIISGTPTSEGSYPITLFVTNAGGTGTATLTLAVAAQAPPAPGITSLGTASATTGVAFSYQITATNSPTSFGASGLPSGMSVDTSTGVISGTSTIVGSYSITLSATNAGGTGTATLTLTVQSTVVPPPTPLATVTASMASMTAVLTQVAPNSDRYEYSTLLDGFGDFWYLDWVASTYLGDFNFSFTAAGQTNLPFSLEFSYFDIGGGEVWTGSSAPQTGGNIFITVAWVTNRYVLSWNRTSNTGAVTTGTINSSTYSAATRPDPAGATWPTSVRDRSMTARSRWRLFYSYSGDGDMQGSDYSDTVKAPGPKRTYIRGSIVS